jgi:antitoxin (DNA-binding transcriptional repressor) of toxin-antitoxin stability system
MHSVSFEYAQTHLAELLAEASGGKSVGIELEDHTVVRLVADSHTPATPKEGKWPFLGRYKDLVLPDGWDDPIPEDHWDVLKS